MEHHRQSSTMREMAMPLMETPEQQRIIELEEQLELNQKELEKTKSQLEIELLDRATEVEGFKNTIQYLVLHNQTSTKNNFDGENGSKIQKLKLELEKVNKKFDDYKLENDKKVDDHKVENDKKLDDLKEQISKRQEQEELQKLRSENARLQEELSDSITETKSLKESIKELEKTNDEKDKNIQELEQTIKQNDFRLKELENYLSEVVTEHDKTHLKFEELKKKYEETVVKLDGMEGLELKHSQLQLQYQQQLQQQELLKQKLDQKVSLHSKEVENCIFAYQKYLNALLNDDKELRITFMDECRIRYNSLSKEDQEKCDEGAKKHREDFTRKKRNFQ